MAPPGPPRPCASRAAPCLCPKTLSIHPKTIVSQEALERAALAPAALRAALCALQPAAGGDAALTPAHWRVIAAGLASGPRAALLLDALFDATCTIYAMVRPNPVPSLRSCLKCCLPLSQHAHNHARRGTAGVSDFPAVLQFVGSGLWMEWKLKKRKTICTHHI